MSYCVKTVLCVIDMKLYQDFLIQQVCRQIGDIQDIHFFECTWKIFDTSAIVIPSYEHTHPYQLHSQFWPIMSTICPCIIKPLVIKKYPHHIGLFLTQEYITSSPSQSQVTMVWSSHLRAFLSIYFSTGLLNIFCFVKKIGITKLTKSNAWSPLPPFLKMLCTLLEFLIF